MAQEFLALQIVGMSQHGKNHVNSSKKTTSFRVSYSWCARRSYVVDTAGCGKAAATDNRKWQGKGKDQEQHKLRGADVAFQKMAFPGVELRSEKLR